MPEFTMDPGQMRRQVQIQQQSATPDSVGQPQLIWTTILTVMAAITATGAKESFATGQFSSQVTHRISIRWPGESVTLLGGQRVLYGARIFLVQAVENVRERNTLVHLMCLEINGNQGTQQ